MDLRRGEQIGNTPISPSGVGERGAPARPKRKIGPSVRRIDDGDGPSVYYSVANEFVDWFNQVDATYRADLRELNESNFIRFDSRLEQRFAEFELRIDRRFAEFEARTNQRFLEFEAKVDQRFIASEATVNQRFALLESRIADLDTKTVRRFAELEAKMDSGFERLRSEMIGFKAELIKWMFLFWLGTLASTLAIIQAVGR